jgi:NAD(P)H-hydrate epimerase
MARLMQTTTQAVQSDRIATARAASARWQSVVVLKGAGTVVHAGRGPAYVNLTGNPGMATAGSGDILAGLLGGLLAGRMDAFGASKLAVYLHGMAGDIATMDTSETSLTSLDIADAIPRAVAELTFR